MDRVSNSNKVVRNKSKANQKQAIKKDKKEKLQLKAKYFYFIGGAIFIILGIILQEYATVGIGIAILASYILSQIYKKTISKW